MENEELVLLLDMIDKKSNIKKILRNGISFSKIPLLVKDSVELGFLTYENQILKLTDEGLVFLASARETMKNPNKDEWIEKDFKRKIQKIEKKVLFLPRQDELDF